MTKKQNQYKVEVVAQAEKSLSKLDKRIQNEVIEVLDSLYKNPTQGATRLRHIKRDVVWRHRRGQARIIFRVDVRNKTVRVIDIGLRREDTYKDLKKILDR